MPTILNLGAVWLNLASDLTVTQSFANATTLKVTTEQDGAIHRQASGRLRAILGPTYPRTWELSFQLCTRTQIDWLEARAGQLMCVRDDRGRKVYGTYFAVAVTEYPVRTDYADASVRIDETTRSEAV